MTTRYFGKIAHVIDQYSMVLNRGANHGVELGQKFRVVRLGVDISDPDTGESLGQLELFQGTVEVINVEPQKSMLRSVDYERQPDKTVVNNAAANLNLLTALALGRKITKDGEDQLTTTQGALLRKPVPAIVGDLAIKA